MNTRDIGMAWTIVLVSAVGLVACWFGYWALSESSANHRREIRERSDGYQQGLIADERGTIKELSRANTVQADYLKGQFCTVFVQIIDPPEDLVAAHNKLCP